VNGASGCGSAFETRYLANLACRLGLLSQAALTRLEIRLNTLCASLVKFVAALELEAAAQSRRNRREQAGTSRPKPDA
jgi:hypothetical protein